MRQLARISPKLWTWLAAKQLSDVSAALNVIVISVYALSLFGDPVILGLILALKMTGSVVGALAVPLVSRVWSSRTVLIVSEVVNGALMIALALAPAGNHAVLLLVLPFFMGLFHGTAHVALYTQVPQFLGPDFRHQLNSILASMDGISVVAGGILAGVLYMLIPVKVIFALDGATFLLSGAMFLLLRVNTAVAPARAETAAPAAGLGRLGRGALKAILPAVGVLFAARFIEAFGSSTHNVGFPILSAAFDPDNQAFLVGWIMAVWGLGKILAVGVTPASIRLLHRAGVGDAQMFIGFLMVTFAFFLGVFLAAPLWLILAFALFAGIFDASTETVYYAILQHSPAAPADQLISLSYFVERLGMGSGILLVGYAFSRATTQEVSSVLYLGAIAAAFCMLLVSLLKRKPYAGQHG